MIARSVGGGRFPSERRQRIQRPLNVKQLRIGVDVHRQVNRAVSHCGLSRARSNSGFGEQRSESMSQGVNVNRSPPLVGFVDARRLQVTVEPVDQPGENGEQWSLAVTNAALLAQLERRRVRSVGRPIPQIVRQVVTSRNRRDLAVLLIGRIQHNERHRPVEFQLSHGERRDFPFAKPRQNERLVNHRPFPPESFELLDGLGIVGQSISSPLDGRWQCGKCQRSLAPVRPLAAFGGRFGEPR